MIRMTAVLIISLIALEGSAEEPKYQDLLNGKDLSGWKPVGKGDNWAVKDEELQCNGRVGAHWIRTEKEYANFDLRLDFKIGKNGNSGLFFRSPEAGNPWVEGLEIQLLDDFGPKWKDLQPDQFTASIYGVQAPSKRATKPAGQWQSMRVHCVDRHVQVWVNGVQVIDTNLDLMLDKAKKVPGLKRKTGYIGFQDHGDAVSFRKIQIRELK